MRMLRTVPASLLLFCTLPIAARAQTGTPAAPPANGPMHLNVVVTPSRGGPVPDLPQSVFTVLDNGIPQPIQSFRAVSGQTVPIKVLIVIDAVNIDFTRLSYERNQIEKFLRANAGKLAEPTSLAVVTDTNTETIPSFTTDGNALAQVLESKQTGLRDLRRSSGFYGAEDRLGLSLRALQNVVASAGTIPGRKMIFWVSPGWPALSGPGVQLTGKEAEGIFRQITFLSAQIRAANVTLYGVDPLGAGEGPGRTYYYEEFLKGVRKLSQVEPGDLQLQVLALQSGGLALSSSNDIAAMLQRCMDDANAFYEMTYMPPPSDAPNQYHEIQVKVAESRLTARTRQGYYSQP